MSAILDLQRTFSLANAKALVGFAADAYNAPHDVQSLTAHVHLRPMPGVTVVAFRGTQDIRDWLTDASIKRRRVPFVGNTIAGTVHEGFIDSTYSVIDQVAALLDRNLPVLLTGHSLGGAQAALAMPLLKMRGLDVLACYTYGQPRLGDGTFCRWYDKAMPKRLFRFVNGSDIVPRAPGLLLGNRHCGVDYFLEPTGGSVVNPALLALAVADVTDWWGEWAKARKLAGLEEHFVKHYQQKVEALN